jgi:hypothetical protein
MAKYYGTVGYAQLVQTSPGVWEEELTEKKYTGDVIRNTRRWQAGEGLNDNLNINNKISILADPYAYQHFHNMRYIEWYGAKWKITNIEVQRPRLILTIGGVYNGDTT